jgi:hypothetical protein
MLLASLWHLLKKAKLAAACAACLRCFAIRQSLLLPLLLLLLLLLLFLVVSTVTIVVDVNAAQPELKLGRRLQLRLFEVVLTPLSRQQRFGRLLQLTLIAGSCILWLARAAHTTLYGKRFAGIWLKLSSSS